MSTRPALSLVHPPTHESAPASDTGGATQPTGHPPDLVEVLARRAEQQARLAQLHAELAITDAAVARALAATNQHDDGVPAREVADPALAISRADRESREPELANQEGRKGDLDNPPSFLHRRFANRDRETRDHSRTDRPDPAESPLTLDEVAQIVEPLRAACRATGRPDRLDDRGRRRLSELGRSALTAGVERFRREVVSDPTIRKPMGVFVRRAEHRDPDTFTSSIDSGRGAVGRHGDDCGCEGRGVVLADPEHETYSRCPGRSN